MKGVCDTLAGEGYHVIMPDVHRGKTAEGEADLLGWVAGNSGWEEVLSADFEAIMQEFERVGVTSVGALGFCWGAWAWAKAAASGIDLKACAACHPSIKLEEYDVNEF